MLSFLVFCVIFIIANGEKSLSKNTDINQHLRLPRFYPVDKELGQGDEVYCKLVDPNDQIVLEGFTRCRLTLDRVGYEHEGLWQMYVGYSGKVTVVKEIISITVTNEGSPKDIVKTEVEKTDPGIKMTCSLPTSFEIRGCQFRGPNDQILLASGSYEETNNGTRYESELEQTVCSVTIVNPNLADIGRWRCALEAVDDIYYAFLAVSVHTQYYVNMEPKIKRNYAHPIAEVENEPITLSCSIDAEIKRCDFRNTNGTVIPVFPGMKTSSMEYVGLGFNAGECGIKMILPVSENEHVWSCNIGLVENTKEYNAVFRVIIKEYLQVTQREIRSLNSGSVIVSASVYDGQTPEYCRFVRSDGLTFTTENAPKPYTGSISGKICEMTTINAIPLDRRPWIVFAKLRHMDWEVNKRTSGLFLEEVTVPTESIQPTEPPYPTRNISNSRPVFLYLMLGIIMLAFVGTIVFAPKRNRQWVSSRAAAARESLRLRKTPLTDVEATMPAPDANSQPPPYARLA